MLTAKNNAYKSTNGNCANLYPELSVAFADTLLLYALVAAKVARTLLKFARVSESV